MAEINSSNNLLATAPRFFTNRDRGEELRDGRQQTSQFGAQNEPANDSIDARSESDLAVRAVQAANSTSDSNAARREQEAVDQPIQQWSPVADQGSGRLTEVALEQQFQRSKVDRNALVEAESSPGTGQHKAVPEGLIQATAEDALGLTIDTAL